jgi:hypothetical protein
MNGPTEQPTNPVSPPLRSVALQDIAQSLAGLLALAYVSGFIVVTAHLGRFGLKDYDAFRVQYLVAGSIVWVVIGLFAYFVGRHVLRLDDDTNECRKLFESLGCNGAGWTAWAFFYTMVELGYFLAVCTLIIGSLLFSLPNTSTILVAVAIVSGQQWINLVMTSAASRHLTKWSFVWFGIFFGTSFVGFFIVADGPYRELLISLCFLAFLLNAYQSQLSHAKNPLLVKAYFVGFSVLFISGAFGTHFYDRVRPSIGGGAPQTVRLIVDETKVPLELRNQLGVVGSTSKSVDLLAETDTEILVGQAMDNNRYHEMFRIKRELFIAISFGDPRPSSAPMSAVHTPRVSD